MRGALAVLLICLSAARPVAAGAWLRDAGRGFLAATTTQRYFGEAWETEIAIYGDYGLTTRLSLGLDINDRPGTAGHVLLFVRFPLRVSWRETRLALELGAGGHHWRKQWSEMGKATLSLGRGFDSRWGQGWVNLDAAIESRGGNPDPIYKLDATAGLSSGPRLRPIVQLETAYTAGAGLGWALTPGVMFDAGKDTTWLIGIERKTAIQSSIGLKFGIWRRF